MKTSVFAFCFLLLAFARVHAGSTENLFLNADFSEGFTSWLGYQGGGGGNGRTEPERFAVLEKGEITITPFTPTGHLLNFYQGFGQHGRLNPPLQNGTTYQFEVDFVRSTATQATLSVIVHFFDASYKNTKRASLPLIQKPGKTTSVQFTVPEGVAIIHVGVSSQGPGRWPGEDFDGSYTVKNFTLFQAPAKK